MKRRHSILSILLCALLLSTAFPVFSAGASARFYNVYGDHMLFQQNEQAVFAGAADAGATVTVMLTDQNGAQVRSVSGQANSAGAFSLSFTAPAGSFDPYTVRLYVNGGLMQTLSDVVFGELWLSFGQSNMEYQLSQTPEGAAMQAAGQTGSRNVRVLQVPHASYAYVNPLTEAERCWWFTGDQTDVYSISAVGYFFAEKLLADLNVPVGILNVAVGGSFIAPWISRAAIESDYTVLSTMVSCGLYIAANNWNYDSSKNTSAMTALYNSKIAPLTNFRPAGAIWYQGESDLMAYNNTAYYKMLFDLLQNSYTAAFSHTNGKLPIIFSQLAAFDYAMSGVQSAVYGKGPYSETKFNDIYTLLVAEDPASRGEVVISDLPLNYDVSAGLVNAIHPQTKKPIGERMAGCAQGLVYHTGAPSSAPARSGMSAQGNSVYVSFSNVGGGLVCNGNTLRGFAVYGADGVCAPANAEIVSANTVRVWNDGVASPVGATYAVNSLSQGANLWSSYNGGLFVPAASFGASDGSVSKLFADADWLHCDTTSAWQTCAASWYKTVWTAQNASISISADAAEGSGSLQVSGTQNSFSVSAPFTESGVFYDSVDTDYSRLMTVSVKLKNAGTTPVTLSELRFYTSASSYTAPICTATGAASVTIPADGAWHDVTFMLWRGAGYDVSMKNVTETRLCFTGSGATVLVDDFRFAPAAQSNRAHANKNPTFIDVNAIVSTSCGPVVTIDRATYSDSTYSIIVDGYNKNIGAANFGYYGNIKTPAGQTDLPGNGGTAPAGLFESYSQTVYNAPVPAIGESEKYDFSCYTTIGFYYNGIPYTDEATANVSVTINTVCSHIWAKTGETAPTCLADGSTTYTCTVSGCGATKTEPIEMLPHDYTGQIRQNSDGGTHSFLCLNGCGEYGGATSCVYGDWSKYNESQHQKSCVCGHAVYENHGFIPETLNGETTYTCAACGYSYTVTEEQPCEHSFVYTKNNDGTHTVICSLCDYPAAIEACTGGAATCIAPAVCEFCGASYGAINAANHAGSQSREAIPATCFAPGHTAGEYCSACETWISGSETAQLSHSYTNYIHIEDGDNDPANDRHNAACANNCGTVDTQSCDFTVTQHAATCTTGAYTTYTCKICGNTVNSAESQPGGHSYVYTSLGDGTHTVTCNSCDLNETAACVYDVEEREATCTMGAHSVFTCKLCGYSYNGEETTELNAHSFIYNSNNNGTHTVTCRNCDYLATVNCSYAETPHTATCTQGAYTARICTVCGYSSNTSPGAPNGHSIVTTSNNNGTHTFSCKNCDYQTTVNCDYTETTYPATHAEGGYTAYTCGVCGYSYNGAFVAPLGHRFTVFVKTVPATCMTNGYDVYRCEDCEQTRERNMTASVDPTNHIGNRVLRGYKAPTQNTDGYSGDIFCDACGTQIETGSVIPKLGGGETEPATPPTPENLCKWDNVDHGASLFGRLIAFFHSILYFFANLFGQK